MDPVSVTVPLVVLLAGDIPKPALGLQDFEQLLNPLLSLEGVDEMGHDGQQ
jgi:hypothetical protein